ncbi:pop3 peptide isoform 1 [Zea mays]|uniref:Stress-response A/B barrel domain-containing protein n=1 Tax=Zea mays TaxID=4577 RepID=A0A804QSJ0_MAIZE|nr:pop3 peptide isoform 1 [Zea mays]|eukprot:NP_001340316.2 pop3 peptide isoform 1 [Zea mays]
MPTASSRRTFSEAVSTDDEEAARGGKVGRPSPPRCSSRRGTDVSIENMHQGFTHVFESTFESTEGIKEYIEHPAHVEFASVFLPVLEKVLIIDYKPTSAN